MPRRRPRKGEPGWKPNPYPRKSGPSGKHREGYKPPTPPTPQFLPIDFECLNCNAIIPKPKWPYLYCSELCAQEAEWVRYYRRVLKDGRYDRPDVREAIRTRMAHLLNGGYAKRDRHLSPEVRRAVRARDRGLCQLCGARATEIDHVGAAIDGDINHLDNLQSLCDSCHHQKTRAHFAAALPGSAEYDRAQTLTSRAKAEVPSRACDDDENWKEAWLQIATERRDAARQPVQGAGTKQSAAREL